MEPIKRMEFSSGKVAQSAASMAVRLIFQTKTLSPRASTHLSTLFLRAAAP